MNHSNAHIRYKALDACLRNRQRKYFFYDLLDAVNEALRNHGEEDVSERTLRADLVRLESEAIGGQDIEIEKLYDGHRVYYRYRDPNFSLFNPIISQQEAELLSSTINLLLRFKGFPQFDWLDETLARLRQTFHLDGTEEDMVSFMQNPDLNGLGHFGRLFDAIVHHEVLAIDYHRFGRPVRTRIIHPYQLRQWNNRWYLVGYEKRQGERFPYVVLPLDRIIKVNGYRLKVNEDEEFVPKPEEVDFDDYFYDIVGISLNPESEPEKVRLKVQYPAVWYIETKPLHPSQRVVEKGDDYKVFQIEVIPNEELVQALLVYADQLEVLNCEWLREKLVERAEAIVKLNGK